MGTATPKNVCSGGRGQSDGGGGEEGDKQREHRCLLITT